MSWFRVDDSMYDHPKFAELPLSAVGLWIKAASYCARYETDGYIKSAKVAPLGGRKRDIDRLVDAGLWEVVSGGYRFHDWDSYNPTKAQQDAKRETDRIRQNRHRHAVTPSGVTEVVTRESERPDPTPKVLNNLSIKEELSLNEVKTPFLISPLEDSGRDVTPGQAGQTHTPNQPSTPTPKQEPTQESTRKTTTQPRSKKKHPLPDDWQPNRHHEQLAAQHGKNLLEEAEKFRDWALGGGKTYADWDRTFNNWLRNHSFDPHTSHSRESILTRSQRAAVVDMQTARQKLSKGRSREHTGYLALEGGAPF